MTGPGWGRRAARAGVLLAALTLCARPCGSGAGEPERFLTNLALMDRLAQEAVEQLLDSLDVGAKGNVTIVSGGYHEANQFVADALAAGLARRGYTVRVGEATSAAKPSGAGTAGERPGGGASTPSQTGAQGEATQPAGNPGSEPLGDLFAPDTTGAHPDSAGWGGEGDSLRSGEAQPGQSQTPVTQPAPPAGEGKATAATASPGSRVYPPGRVVEYRVLEFGVHYPSLSRRFLLFGSATVQRLGGVYLQASVVKGPEGEILGVARGQSHAHDRLSGRARTIAEGATYPFQKPTVPASKLTRAVEPIVVAGIIASLVYLFYQNQN